MLKPGNRLIQSTLAKYGYRLAPGAYGLDCLFPLLKGLGFVPKHVVDVGANRGFWTRTALRYFPDASYTLVEPQGELKTYIQDLIEQGYRIQWVHAGAAEKSGFLPLTIRERDDSSNFLIGEQEARTAGLRRIMVEIRTLDEIVASSNLPIPDIVKIDAEGFDLKVLSGASSLIGKTEIFFLEAAVRGCWENNVLEVLRRMAEGGYELFDVTQMNRSPKYAVLWLLELAFLRKGSHLLDAVQSYE